ncbi:hypothetical protein NMY22_g8374 [Coprinellus aureogranulatus]|nr:hypothetical protein NMY22_g8374 [Coprinellus aureogranulatus]
MTTPTRNRKHRARGRRTVKSATQKSEKPRDPRATPPPSEYPHYPKHGMTSEECWDIERRQREWIAYYGRYPWQSLLDPESSESEADEAPRSRLDDPLECDEQGDMGPVPVGNTCCPHSLDDADTLRILEVVLNVVHQALHERSTDDLSQTISSPNQPPSSSPLPSTLSPAVVTSPPPNPPDVQTPGHRTMPNIAHEVTSRLRPKDKLKKTEKAQKIYRR